MKYVLLLFMTTVLCSCDKGMFVHFTIPISTDKTYTSDMNYESFTNEIAKIAAEYNLTERPKAVGFEPLIPDGTIEYSKSNFTMIITPPSSNRLFRITLVDFPGYRRSELSKEIEIKLINSLPRLTIDNN